MDDAIWIGIDVAKPHLDVAIGVRGTVRRYRNTPAGHRQLLVTLREVSVAGVVLEATGGYHRAIVEALGSAGYAPAVLNPQWFKAFKRSAGRRAKTDALDARELARYGHEKQPVPTRAVTPAEQALRELVRRREDLVAARAAEKNRRQHATDPVIQTSIASHMAWLTSEIRDLETAIDATIAADPAWAAERDRLASLRGIGHVTSAVLIAFLPELAEMDRRQLAAVVGLAPYADDSGTHRGQRHIAGGRSCIRRVLYQAAMVAVRREPTFRAQKRRMQDAGKPHKVIMVAIARRMLGVLGAMEREQLHWEETRNGQGMPGPAAAPPEAAAA